MSWLRLVFAVATVVHHSKNFNYQKSCFDSSVIKNAIFAKFSNRPHENHGNCFGIGKWFSYGPMNRDQTITGIYEKLLSQSVWSIELVYVWFYCIMIIWRRRCPCLRPWGLNSFAAVILYLQRDSDSFFLAYPNPTRFPAIFTRSGYFHLIPGGCKTTSCTTSGLRR